MPYKDKTKQLEYQNNWMKKNREEWLKGKTCSNCGSDNNLQVDHRDPQKKVSHRIWSWSKVRRIKELNKCQALCLKCHKEKTRSEIAKLTPFDIRLIRSLHDQGLSSYKIAKWFEVGDRYIRRICTKEEWADI